MIPWLASDIVVRVQALLFAWGRAALLAAFLLGFMFGRADWWGLLPAVYAALVVAGYYLGAALHWVYRTRLALLEAQAQVWTMTFTVGDVASSADVANAMRAVRAGQARGAS